MTDGNEPEPLRVLFATAEMFPYAKVGGLADVSAALPKALAKNGQEVRVVMPAYRGLGGDPVLSFDVQMGHGAEPVTVRHLVTVDGVRVMTVGAPGWFESAAPYGYQDEDVLPFVLFSKAVARLAAHPGWRPHVIHGNDWHCGLIGQEVREGSQRELLDEVGLVLTIHNLAYQGRVGAATDQIIGLSPAGSLLARGVAYSDQLSTVSPTYLEEILTPAYGAGMHTLLRSRRADTHGILNGVDYEAFAPEHDPWIDVRYDGSFIVGKRANKRTLQRESGIASARSSPLFAMVSRLVPQKGIPLACRAVDELVARGGQVVVMGRGERRYEATLRALAARYPESVAYLETTEESVARRVYAGADIFLAPSTFEPCGLTPLISLRYGTIPVVRKTGGMADTISDYGLDPVRGLGFCFRARRPSALLAAVDDALAVYHRTEEWNDLQRRAMAANFSWQRPAQQYVEMYRTAVRRRQAASPALPRTPVARRTSRNLPLPLALVHHLNQYLITDGYADREGITSLVDGYTALLHLHEKHRVPAHLHLSGTLIEATAWWRPDFLALVRRLRESRLVSLIGGTYSESVLTAFDEEFNRRQLALLFCLYEEHLRCPPEELDICWIPERVWHTDLAGQLTSPELPNGGYRYVLLDDRLLYPAGTRYAGSDREQFDATDRSSPPPADAARPYRIAGGKGLHVLPISTRLRYWVPPADKEHWSSLSRMADMTTAPGDGVVLVYADDMEKTAGVGPWNAGNLQRYDAFLRWVTAQANVVPVSLRPWLGERRRPPAVRDIEPGTFVELALEWKAGEDYAGWSGDATWAPYRKLLADSEAAVLAASQAGATGSLYDLAWKHLLASGYETGWRDTVRPDRPVAAWAKALASHARSSMVLADAAVWFSRRRTGVRAELTDLDGDGEEELVLANDQLYAVLTPRHGGRLVYLAGRTDTGGALVIGNPSDDWNWQESMNRYMDRPANHPGALCDAGAVDDRYIATVRVLGDAAVAELMNVEDGSPVLGLRKRLVLTEESRALFVEYDHNTKPDPLLVSCCLSPDYYTLLQRGRSALQPYDGPGWRGLRTGPVTVWLAVEESGATGWADRPRDDVGHGVVLHLSSRSPTFRLVAGTGPTDRAACRERLQEGRRVTSWLDRHDHGGGLPVEVS